jgi:O-antigen/teichoic acid export membrane protein
VEVHLINNLPKNFNCDIMEILLPRNFAEIKRHLNDPLYKNSFFILLTMVISAVIGFLFWIIAAKYYSQVDVGLNTALISAMSLISLLSYMGLDQSIIRFFPNGNKLKILTTSIIVITISTIIFGIIFIVGINIWSPQLDLIQNYLLIFFVSLIAFSLTQPTAQAFIALRRSKYYFYQNLFLGLRLILILLPFLGKLGIFLSFSISSIIAVIFSFFFIYTFKLGEIKLKELFSIDWDYIKDSFRFSTGNYFFVILFTAPGYILPIIVLNTLGSEQTAYYYIAYTIGSILFMISAAFATSLFVEGSHGESLRKSTLKSSLAIFIVLTPIAIMLYLFGGLILGLIGANYVYGTNLLKTIVLSSFFYAICMIFISIRRIQKNMWDLILISFIIFLLLIGLSYPLMIKFGIIGVGYAFIISYLVVSIIILIKIRDIIRS